ncbi:hypothetical protein [Propionispora vibrioides]|uniref:Uncharacterized protein n=1 Tax=Propionispora vibrioides TaxID=112903 RepID=A0A1H8SIH0_9FIRM|nr:hypothetical protein [Propionispora vibrioides]SEO78462.1 hypothetical protein SAMN04490178_10578 [Propionispora vibrioides]
MSIKDTDHVALYYPYLMPTNSLWLKQPLFYWDHIQSILPDNAKERYQVLTPDLQFLEAEGIFSTIDPGYITYLLDLDAIVDDVRKVLKSSSFPLLKKGIFASLGISYEASYSHYTPI